MIIRDQFGETFAFPAQHGGKVRKMRRHLALNTTSALRLLGGKGRCGTEIHSVNVTITSSIAPRDGIVEAMDCPVEYRVGDRFACDARRQIPHQFTDPNVLNHSIEK